jgi:flagellar hook-length control protein FliK
MTQVSVTPPAATTAAAPAAAEGAPPVLAQAGQRAEFAARLLAALSALRGGIPSAPAPTAAESPARPPELAAAPLEETSAEELPEETAATESAAEGESAAAAASAVPDTSAELAPLVLVQFASDDTPEEPSGGEGAPALEIAAGPATAERTPDATPPRPAAFAPAQPLPEPSAPAERPEPPAAREPGVEAVPLDTDAATASAAQAVRADRSTGDAPSPAPERAPGPEAALSRGPELAAPPGQSARSESAAPVAGRVLPELPVRNEQEIVDQVRFLLNRKGGQASIELHPPQLGQVGLRISVTDHAVRLEITADRLPVAELLHKHLPQLQQALEAQGLQIDRAQVDLRERASDGRERGGDPGDAEARRGRDSDGDRAERDPGYRRGPLPAYSLGAVDVHA